MFINVNHKNLHLYKLASDLISNCYKVSDNFPLEEKFNLTQQLKRAAISVQLNIAEGSSRKSLVERKRFYEIARGSIIEIDTILEIGCQLQYIKKQDLNQVGTIMNSCFAMISKMI
jgi:four helix bundle protein